MHNRQALVFDVGISHIGQNVGSRSEVSALDVEATLVLSGKTISALCW